MILKLYKIKHFWKDGKSATWVKSDKITTKEFNSYKDSYNSIKYSKDKYIKIKGKNFLLFYQSKTDNFNRPITEITAVKIDKEIKDLTQLHNIIQDKLEDLFKDTLEDTIEIDSNLIKQDKKIIYLSIALIIILLLYLFKSLYPTTLSSGVEVKMWRWDSFCQENNKEQKIPNCLSSFIEQKCEKRDKFIYYIDYMRDNCSYHKCNKSSDILRCDNDFKRLKENNREINIRFFIDRRQ